MPPESRTTTQPGLPGLDRDELRRYARHLVLPQVGPEGQRRLKAARVACVGAGGLGSPAALYLAAAGVGTLGLIDDDTVDATNLQRQILHGTADIGRSKLDSALDRLADVNPHVELVAHRTRLTSENALDVLDGYDVVVDGTDNFPTRYLVNDACVLLGTPNVYGSILRWEGQVSVFAAPEGWAERFEGVGAGDVSTSTEPGPCYRCLFREPPPPELVEGCAEGGVMGMLPGVMGSLQAVETVKWILGVGRPLVGRLQIFDALGARWREVALRRNPDCPVCGDAPTQRELIDYEEFCGIADGGAAPTPEVDPAELAARLDASDAPLLLDVREPWEWGIGNLAHLGAVHVPLGELDARMDEVPRDRPVVAYCRAGGRSAQAAERLREAGYPDVTSLRGGLAAWRDQVDPDVGVG